MNNRKKIILQNIFNTINMRKTLIRLLIITLLASYGCTHKVIEKHTKFISDTLLISFQNRYQTLFPPSVNDKVSSQIVTQLYNGLVAYNPKNLKIQPAIAKSWEKDETGTVYTFHLNTGVYFNANPVFDNRPKQLTIDDIMFSFQYLCTKLPGNKNFFSLMYKVKGAKEYYDTYSELKNDFDIEGIKAINDSTLQITVEDKNYPLLDVLALPFASVFSHKAYKKLKEECYMGTGPYSLAKQPEKNATSLMLVYNPYYFLQDNSEKYYPYISNVSISFIPSRKKELKLLQEGKLDIILGLNNNDLLKFLEQNIEVIESKNPKFIVSAAKGNASDLQDIYSSKVMNFYSNAMLYLDLSIIYFKKNK